MQTRAKSNMTQKLQRVEAILRQADFSPIGADTCQVPFFVKSIDQEVTLDVLNRESTPQYREEVDQMATRYNFSPLLKYLYLMLGNGQREFTYRGLIFHSFERVKERQAAYAKEGQDNICDLAIAYHGMGWVYALALDTESQKYFVRMDGGSNGYDRDFNWEYYKGYRPSSKPDTLFDESKVFNPDNTHPVDFADGSYQVVQRD